MGTTRSGWAVILHWLAAAPMGGACLIGLSFRAFPSAQTAALMPIHQFLGLCVLLAAIPRLATSIARLSDRGRSRHGGGGFEAVVRTGLYGVMLALPGTGLIMWSSGIDPDPVAVDLHRALGLAFVALLALHVGAAVWRAFVSRGDVLDALSMTRLAPGRPTPDR